MAAASVISVIAGGSAIASAVEARKGRKDQARARKIQEKRGRLQAGRQAVDQVRQAQIARANVTQQAESTGVGDSSAVAGAKGSIQSQAGSNISFAQTLFNLSQQANRRLESANKHFSTSQTFGQITNLATSAS